MATTQEILQSFETYVDDTTELSSTQELTLANKIYRRVLNAKVWEFLKKEFIGVTNGTDSITLPADFMNMLENYGYTDNTIEQGGKYVFIGPNLTPYKVINWSDRKQYRNDDQVCYIDIATGVLKFPKIPNAGLVASFDYIYRPADLTLVTSPVFPSDFHDIIYHGMAVDDYIIQQFDKARSYANENKAMYDSYLADLSSYNSKLITISM